MSPSGETLVGREPELERIEPRSTRSQAAAAGCLAIEGEPGIGKTRLLAELRERAEERGHLVLTARRPSSSATVPFGVLVEALDAVPVARSSTTASARSRRRCATSSAAIFPSLRGSGDDADAAIGDERYRAHRAVRALLELLADDKPLVIVLDDLHWADGATIELLGALLRRAPEAPVLLVLAFRPGQRARAPLVAALAAPLDDADRAGAAERGRGGGAARRTSTRRAARRSTVTAAATRSTSSSWRGSGAAAARARTAAPTRSRRVPAGVAASLAEELAALSASARALLEAAAVAGEPFDPALAGEIAELDEAAALAALDELLGPRSGATDRVPRRFIFRHPLVRRSGLRGDRRRLEAGRARARGRQRWRARCGRDRARAPRRAGGRPGRRRRRSSPAGGRRGGRRRARPAVAARWLEAALRLLLDERSRAPGHGPGRARLGAALDRRARALPRRPAGDD